MQEDYGSIVCLLHEAHRVICERERDALRKIGISFPQIMILGYLHRNTNEEVNQRKICEIMYLKGSSVTSLMNNMEKNGLIMRRTDPSDGRGNIIELTEKGKETALKIRGVLDEIDEKSVSVFDDDEKKEMERLLLKIKSTAKKDRF